MDALKSELARLLAEEELDAKVDAESMSFAGRMRAVHEEDMGRQVYQADVWEAENAGYVDKDSWRVPGVLLTEEEWDAFFDRYQASFKASRSARLGSGGVVVEEDQEADEKVAWKEKMDAWKARGSGGEGDVIVYDDVPFPDLEGKGLGGLFPPGQDPEGVSKAQLREAYLMWHPDKFVQKYGSRLHPDHSARILSQVTTIAQRLSDLKSSLR